MKTYLSSPKDEAFFNKYAVLVSTLSITAILGQIISGTTESTILYTQSLQNFIKFVPEYAAYIAGAVALLGVVMIEGGLRVLLPISIRSLLYKRFKGLDLIVTILAIPAAPALLFISAWLSFSGSYSLVDSAVGEAEQETTVIADSTKTAEVMLLDNEYKSSKAELESMAALEKAAVQSKYTAKVGAVDKKIESYKAKEITTGSSYSTRINRLEETKAGLVAKQMEAEAEITAALATDKKALKAALDQARDKVLAKHTKATDAVASANTLAVQKNIKLKSEQGGKLGYLTVVMLVILIVSITLKEIHYKGSQIEQRVEVKQSYFEQGIVASFFNSVGAWLEVRARKVIQKIERSTEDTLKPIAPPLLYDRGSIKQRVVQLEPERRKIGYEITEPVVVQPFVSSFTAHQNKQNTEAPKDDKKTTGKPKKDYTIDDIKRRIKDYKKRLGSHKQKARLQKNKQGYAYDRTLNAIKNNEKWIAHYESKLQEAIDNRK